MSENKQHCSLWQDLLLKEIDVGVVVVDQEFTVLEWNSFMENHSGLIADNVVNKDLFTCFPDIDKSWLRAKAEPVFTLDTPVFLIWEQRPYLFKFAPTRPVTSASSFMYQNITMIPVPDNEEQGVRLCILVYDVTDEAIDKLNIEVLNKELKAMSRIDGMTGLYNRKHWQERFDEQFKLAHRRDTPVSVMMLDIDHFKKVNDTWGHQAGDKAIKTLASILAQCTRETDTVGRYGGEEFAVILPGTDAQGTHIVAERIRETAEASTIIYEDQQFSFTVSLGIAEYHDNYESAAKWLEDADQALYDAKLSGRNRTLIAK